MNLSIRQLQTFVEVMRTGSVSEAGRSLGRTQPAVSAMIAALEVEIGFPLFERQRGRLVPKPEAHYFLEESEFVLARLSQSTRTLHEIGNLEIGKLKIACNPSASSFFMPRVVGGFLKDKPGVDVSLMMRSSPIVIDWIASQQYDVGLAETSEPRGTINSEDFAFPCVCALPKNDPLGLRKTITPTDLNDRPAALLYDDHATNGQTRAAFASVGANLNQRFELRTFLPTLQLVAQGLCYTICDSFSAISYEQSMGDRSEIVFRPFKPTIFLWLSIITPANRPASMLVRAFVAELCSEMSQLLDEAERMTV